MKITAARVIVCCPGRNFVTLKIETDQGLSGVGDATLNGRELAVASYLQDHVLPCLIGRDPRNWGVCRPVGSGAPSGNKIEDTINGQMLLTGWALPKEDHGKEWMALGIQARNAKAGLWAGYVVPDPVKVGTLYGVTEVNDGNKIGRAHV